MTRRPGDFFGLVAVRPAHTRTRVHDHEAAAVAPHFIELAFVFHCGPFARREVGVAPGSAKLKLDRVDAHRLDAGPSTVHGSTFPGLS